MFLKKSLIFAFLSLAIAFPVLASDCEYEFNKQDTKLEWTAYKFTEKSGVKGSFTSFDVTTSRKVKNIAHILNHLKFKIETNSVNTGKPERDTNIVNYFFNKLENPGQIIGEFIKVDSKKGMATVKLLMGGKTRKVPLHFIVKDNMIQLKGSVRITEWNSSQAVDSLSKQCYDLHKGKDGISKLWPDVDIEITANLKKSCK